MLYRVRDREVRIIIRRIVASGSDSCGECDILCATWGSSAERGRYIYIEREREQKNHKGICRWRRGPARRSTYHATERERERASERERNWGEENERTERTRGEREREEVPQCRSHGKHHPYIYIRVYARIVCVRMVTFFRAGDRRARAVTEFTVAVSF